MPPRQQRSMPPRGGAALYTPADAAGPRTYALVCRCSFLCPCRPGDCPSVSVHPMPCCRLSCTAHPKAHHPPKLHRPPSLEMAFWAAGTHPGRPPAVEQCAVERAACTLAAFLACPYRCHLFFVCDFAYAQARRCAAPRVQLLYVASRRAATGARAGAGVACPAAWPPASGGGRRDRRASAHAATAQRPGVGPHSCALPCMAASLHRSLPDATRDRRQAARLPK